MRGIALSLISALAFLSGGASAAPIQWTVESGGNGHWYDIITGGGDGVYLGAPTGGFTHWDDARVDAENRGGYLATFTSQAEWSFFQTLYPLVGTQPGWLGGFQNTASPSYSEPGGGWEWVTGEPWGFAPWACCEPNNASAAGEDYLVVWHLGGTPYTVWNDHYSPYPAGFGYGIEYETNPVPEPGTALLLGLGLTALAVRRGA